MNLFKKTTATIALVALMSGIFSTGVSAYSSTQVEAANALAEAGIINDHSSDAAAYNLDQNVLRQEIAAVARGIAGLEKKSSCDNVFADVSATTPNTWACLSVEALADAELIAKNDNFRPEANISKAEAVGMMVKAAFGDDYSYDASKGTSWQEQVVEFAAANGVVASFTNYDTAATRGFVFESGANSISSTEEDDSDDILSDLLGGLDDDEDTTMEEEDTDTVVVAPVSGDNVLMVELSPESPTNGVVAGDRARTEVLAFDVTAGSEDVTLKEVTLEYIGLSNADDVEVLAVYLNNEKVTKGDTKSFSDNERDLAFENDTVIKAGESQTLFVTASIKTTSATVSHKIAVTNIDATSNVEGDYISSVSFGVVNADNVASLDLDINSQSSKVVVGEVETLADFSLEEKDDKEDVILKAFTIEFDSIDAEDDLSDITLLADGVEIASNLMVNSDDEVIVNLDYVISADDKVDFELTGVITGSIGDTVDAKFTDIYAVGANTSLVAKITGDDITTKALSGDYSEATTSLIEGSEINVSFDKSDIDEAKPSAEGVLVGTLKLSSVGDYTVDSIEVTAVSTGTGIEQIIDVVELGGSSSDSEAYSTVTTFLYTGVYTFEDISLKSGEDKEFDITFDVNEDTALNGADVKFSVKIIKVTDEENDEEYTSGTLPKLSTILSTNSLDDKTVDIETASLTLTQTKVTDRELVLGNGVEVVLYKGKLSLGDSDDVTLEDLVFTGDIKTSTGLVTTDYDFDDLIDSAELNIGGKTFDADVNSSEVEFKSINAVVAAGSDNVEVTLTATLKDTDDVNQGDVLTLDNVAVVSEDSEWDALLNQTVNATTSDTIVTLNENGSLDFVIVNNGDNKDEIEDVVLAGTNSVALAEVELEANDEDVKIKELVFKVLGKDVSTTLADVRLVNGSSVIADSAVITFDSTDTVITFENDFVVEDSSDEIKALLVADIERITTEGGAVSADPTDLSIDLISVEAKGVNSNDDIFANNSTTIAILGGDTAQSTAVTVVPALVTVSIDDELGTNDSDAIITFSIDKGNNDLDNDDVVVYSVELETAVVGSGVTIRNDDNETILTGDQNATLDLSGVSIDLAKIVDGDEYEFSVENDNDEVRIVKYGVTYWIDLDESGDTTNTDGFTELFKVSNDKVIDLGEYDAD